LRYDDALCCFAEDLLMALGQLPNGSKSELFSRSQCIDDRQYQGFSEWHHERDHDYV
jgi:hypothetical protein